MKDESVSCCTLEHIGPICDLEREFFPPNLGLYSPVRLKEGG